MSDGRKKSFGRGSPLLQSHKDELIRQTPFWCYAKNLREF